MSASIDLAVGPLSCVQSILLIRLGAIGDALRVVPALRRVRRKFPRSHIGWLVEDWVAPLLEGHPDIDSLHIVKRSELEGGVIKTLGETLRIVSELRCRNYEVALDFHGRFKSGLLSRLAGIPQRIGYARGQSTELNFLFNNIRVTLDDPLESRVLRFLHLLEPLGIDTNYDAADSGIFVAESVKSEALAWHKSLGSPPLAAYPGCSIGRAAFQRWPVEKWCELLNALGGRGVRTVVFWGPDELEMARAIVLGAGSSCELAPTTGLQQMLAMLGLFRGYIGSNTAATHMAWLQGVPTVLFSGAAEPRTDAPLAPLEHRVLGAREFYVPGKSKRHQPQVTTEVAVAQALKAVTDILCLENKAVDGDPYRTKIATAS